MFYAGTVGLDQVFARIDELEPTPRTVRMRQDFADRNEHTWTNGRVYFIPGALHVGFLTVEGENAMCLVNNLDWTGELTAIDFLREIGKHYRVGTMLKKDAVASRLNSDAGISYTEFSYQILQGMDYLELFRRHGCRLQFGGSDQWGNLTGGVELIRRAVGGHAHAFATPLVLGDSKTVVEYSETGTARALALAEGRAVTADDIVLALPSAALNLVWMGIGIYVLAKRRVMLRGRGPHSTRSTLS